MASLTFSREINANDKFPFGLPPALFVPVRTTTDNIMDIIYRIETKNGTDFGYYIKPEIYFLYHHTRLYKYLQRQFGYDNSISVFGPWHLSLYRAYCFFPEANFEPDDLELEERARPIVKGIIDQYLNRYGNVWDVFYQWGGTTEYADNAMVMYHETFIKSDTN